LDELFALPAIRIKYYRKLYSRLLKSTVPGKSDHKVLVSAVDKLDMLLGNLEQRSSILVGQRVEMEDEVVISPTHHAGPPKLDLNIPQSHSSATSPISPSQPTGLSASFVTGTESGNSSTRGSAYSSDQRHSHETGNTSLGSAQAHDSGLRGRGTDFMSMPITELEKRLSTRQTLDIFTMKPKV
jgi:hypothetical protein